MVWGWNFGVNIQGTSLHAVSSSVSLVRVTIKQSVLFYICEGHTPHANRGVTPHRRRSVKRLYSKNYRDGSRHSQLSQLCIDQGRGQWSHGQPKFCWSTGQHNTSECSRCCYEHGWDGQHPVCEQIYRQCLKKGHFKCMCKNVREAASDQEDFASDSVIQDDNNPWTINIKIKEMDVPIKIDTGEDISFMNVKTFVYLNKKNSSFANRGSVHFARRTTIHWWLLLFFWQRFVSDRTHLSLK